MEINLSVPKVAKRGMAHNGILSDNQNHEGLAYAKVNLQHVHFWQPGGQSPCLSHTKHRSEVQHHTH